MNVDQHNDRLAKNKRQTTETLFIISRLFGLEGCEVMSSIADALNHMSSDNNTISIGNAAGMAQKVNVSMMLT